LLVNSSNKTILHNTLTIQAAKVRVTSNIITGEVEDKAAMAEAVIKEVDLIRTLATNITIRNSKHKYVDIMKQVDIVDKEPNATLHMAKKSLES